MFLTSDKMYVTKNMSQKDLFHDKNKIGQNEYILNLQNINKTLQNDMRNALQYIKNTQMIINQSSQQIWIEQEYINKQFLKKTHKKLNQIPSLTKSLISFVSLITRQFISHQCKLLQEHRIINEEISGQKQKIEEIYEQQKDQLIQNISQNQMLLNNLTQISRVNQQWRQQIMKQNIKLKNIIKEHNIENNFSKLQSLVEQNKSKEKIIAQLHCRQKQYTQQICQLNLKNEILKIQSGNYELQNKNLISKLQQIQKKIVSHQRKLTLLQNKRNYLIKESQHLKNKLQDYQKWIQSFIIKIDQNEIYLTNPICPYNLLKTLVMKIFQQKIILNKQTKQYQDKCQLLDEILSKDSKKQVFNDASSVVQKIISENTYKKYNQPQHPILNQFFQNEIINQIKFLIQILKISQKYLITPIQSLWTHKQYLSQILKSQFNQLSQKLLIQLADQIRWFVTLLITQFINQLTKITNKYNSQYQFQQQIYQKQNKMFNKQKDYLIQSISHHQITISTLNNKIQILQRQILKNKDIQRLDSSLSFSQINLLKQILQKSSNIYAEIQKISNDISLNIQMLNNPLVQNLNKIKELIIQSNTLISKMVNLQQQGNNFENYKKLQFQNECLKAKIVQIIKDNDKKLEAIRKQYQQIVHNSQKQIKSKVNMQLDNINNKLQSHIEEIEHISLSQIQKLAQQIDKAEKKHFSQTNLRQTIKNGSIYHILLDSQASILANKKQKQKNHNNGLTSNQNQDNLTTKLFLQRLSKKLEQVENQFKYQAQQQIQINEHSPYISPFQMRYQHLENSNNMQLDFEPILLQVQMIHQILKKNIKKCQLLEKYNTETSLFSEIVEQVKKLRSTNYQLLKELNERQEQKQRIQEQFQNRYEYASQIIKEEIYFKIENSLNNAALQLIYKDKEASYYIEGLFQYQKKVNFAQCLLNFSNSLEKYLKNLFQNLFYRKQIKGY